MILIRHRPNLFGGAVSDTTLRKEQGPQRRRTVHIQWMQFSIAQN